jgi:hypothetical protein
MNEDEKLVVKWLESPDGELWSREFHRDANRVNPMPSALMTVKSYYDDFAAWFEIYLWVA